MDASKMHSMQRPAGYKLLKLDDGKDGTPKIWQVEGSLKKEIPKNEWGQFYSKKSYVMLYSYGNNQRFHIYFWQGADGAIKEKGFAAGITTEINVEMCKNMASTQRIPQFHESKHFLKIFENKFVIHSGDPEENRLNSVKLFHMRGTKKSNTRTYEVPKDGTRLYSGDVFILTGEETTYIWHGTMSNVYCQNNAQELIKNNAFQKIIGDDPKIEIISEGNEPEKFWENIGGKKEYLNKIYKQEPKLFSTNNDLGIFQCLRNYDFAQDDLISEKIFILDLFDTVYLWIGRNFDKPHEKKLGLELVDEYIEAARDKREKNPGKYVVEGNEPLEFGMAFDGFKFRDFTSETGIGLCKDLLAKEFPDKETYTFAELKDRKNLPAHLNRSELETYLSPEEFSEVFGYSKEEYNSKPNWKKEEDRKRVGLY